MEMQIKADFAALTAEQREHLAGFILTFPPIPEGMSVNYAKARKTVEGDNIVPVHIEPDAPAAIDPAAAFGAQAPISQAGPVLVVGSAPPPPPLSIQKFTIQRNDVDKHGLPWDGRIHASTKARNADGSWRTKRGLDPAVLAQVEAELKAVMAIPGSPAPGPQLVPAPPPPPPAQQAAPAAPAADDGRLAFVALVGRASAAMQAGKLTQEEIQSCCKSIDPNLVALPLLANRFDLVPQVAALIDGIVAGRNV